MSLFLSSVPSDMTVDDLERIFDETFGATVMVRFGKVLYGKTKSANVEVLGNTSEMKHFISQVMRFGSNGFIANSVNYTVRMNTRSEAVCPKPSTFIPYIA